MGIVNFNQSGNNTPQIQHRDLTAGSGSESENEDERQERLQREGDFKAGLLLRQRQLLSRHRKQRRRENPDKQYGIESTDAIGPLGQAEPRRMYGRLPRDKG